jgi:hypothetical protein
MKRWAGFSERNFSEVLTKFMFARMEHLPSAIYDMKWCSAITATALNSVRPVLNPSITTLACCVLFSCCRSNEVLRRTYGKDNRVLRTAKLSQGFKVVPPSRTWQGAGISTGGTKIGVTGSETRTAKLRLSKVKQQSWASRRVAELWWRAPL